MTVEELYWALKAFRDAGHASDKVLLAAYDDNGDEVINTLESHEFNAYLGKSHLYLVGDSL